MKTVTKSIGFVLIMVLALGLTVVVAGAADDEIRLGVISPASGNYADLGAAERRGITMAVRRSMRPAAFWASRSG